MICPTGAKPGLAIETMESGGIQRSYRLYVPASYDASKPLPLLLNFHGLGSTAEQQELYSGFTAVADREGFILVSPDGLGLIHEWHVFGPDEPGYVDDIAFVDALIDRVSSEACVDPQRIYADGISNGGAITSLLGCNLDRIAAIATVAGAPYSQDVCQRDRPVPIIAFHGTDDFLAPFNMGDFLLSVLPIADVRDDMAIWAQNNGCDPTLQSDQIASDVTLESYRGCDENADVQLYVVENGGHTWPGADFDISILGRTTQSIDASELIWSFFKAHPRQ